MSEPEETPAGYTHLCWKYRVDPEILRRQSFIRNDHRPRSARREGARTVETFPIQYTPDGDDFDHLQFALKYDGIDLLALSRLVPHLDRHELSRRITERPTSANGRRLFFLFEWLTGERLDIEDLTRGNYCDVLDQKHYYTSAARRSRRHRVMDNVLGEPGFCPTVRRTEALRRAEEARLDVRAREIASQASPGLLARTIRYLYTKETKSSFEIEREDPGDRLERYVDQLARIGELPLSSETGLTDLQNSLVDHRFSEAGFRHPGADEVYVGETIGFSERIHHVGLRSDLVPEVMTLWARLRPVTGDLGPVVDAACQSFTFVFIHPFGDGNGRIHRLLLHHILAKREYMPSNLVVPISSVISNDMDRYDATLEDFSRRAMRATETSYKLDEDGRLEIQKQRDDLFRYPDLTAQVESTFGWLRQAIEEDLLRELDFLSRFDTVRSRMREVVNLPDRLEQLFVKLCLHNRGTISKRKRHHFSALDDETVARLESIVRDEMSGTSYDGVG